MKRNYHEHRFFTFPDLASPWFPAYLLDFPYQIQSGTSKKTKVRRGTPKVNGHKIKMGRFFSAKNKSSLLFRSRLEEQWYKALEANPAVRGFYNEPFNIPYVWERRKRLYHPDLLVAYTDGREVLVEIKHSGFVAAPRDIEKWERASQWCATRNLSFEIWRGPPPN